MPRDSAEPRYIQSLHPPRIEGFSWVSPQDELDERIYREVSPMAAAFYRLGAVLLSRSLPTP
jgi:hypothetical protein